MAGRSAAYGRAGLALAACLLTTGCGDSVPATRLGARTQAILGGEAEDALTSVVALSIHASSGEEGLCSGFVIDSHAVLTAAHCVAPEAVGQGASFSLFLGSDLGDPAQRAAPENELAIDRVVFDPEFSLGPIGHGHDVALAFTRVPLTPTPLSLAPPPTLDGVGAAAIVGYGVSVADDGASAGRRRRGSVVLAGFDAKFLELGAGTGPCHGDSGGPVLVVGADGLAHVAGVVSFTDGDCAAGSRATRLESYLPFIDAEIEAGGAPPAEQSSCQHARGPASGTAGWSALVVLGLLLRRSPARRVSPTRAPEREPRQRGQRRA